jgi:hypothetical protein
MHVGRCGRRIAIATDACRRHACAAPQRYSWNAAFP